MNLGFLTKMGFDSEWANGIIKNTLLKDDEGTKSIVLSLDEKGEAKITRLKFDAIEKMKEMQALIKSNKVKVSDELIEELISEISFEWKMGGFDGIYTELVKEVLKRVTNGK